MHGGAYDDDGCVLDDHVCRITCDGHVCGSGRSREMVQILKKMLVLVGQFCPGL